MAQQAVESGGIGAYREHTQQRRLPCILQSDHGYVHLCCPVRIIHTSTSFEVQHDYTASRHMYWGLIDERAITAQQAHDRDTPVKDLPEQPQKPVIDLLEYAGHIDKRSIAIYRVSLPWLLSRASEGEVLEL